MSLNILDIIDEAVREVDSFESHPVKALPLEEQLLYLQGISLVMSVDNEIHDSEVAYLKILINSFGLDNSILDGLKAFSRQPDKETIQNFFKNFRRQPIAQLVLFDALMMSRRDERVHDNEIAIVNKYAQQLEIPTGTHEDIFRLFCYLSNQDWDKSLNYLHSHHIDQKHFQHLLAYFEVDVDKLSSDLHSAQAKNQQSPMSKKINTSLQWEPLAFIYKAETEAKEITIKPVDFYTLLNHKEYVIPWMQSLLDRRMLTVSEQQQLSLKLEGKALNLGNLKGSGIQLDIETNHFFYSENTPFKAPFLLLTSYIAYLVTGEYELTLNSIKDFNHIIQTLTGDDRTRIAEGIRRSTKETKSRTPAVTPEASSPLSLLFPLSQGKPITGEIVNFTENNRLIRTNKKGYVIRPMYNEKAPLLNIFFSGQFRLIR